MKRKKSIEDVTDPLRLRDIKRFLGENLYQIHVEISHVSSNRIQVSLNNIRLEPATSEMKIEMYATNRQGVLRRK